MYDCTLLENNLSYFPLICCVHADLGFRPFSYEMFDRLVEMKAAVALFQAKPTGKVFSFSGADWQLAEDIVLLLRPAYNATKEISSEKYVSGSKVIPLVKHLFSWYHKKEVEYLDIARMD